MVQHQLAVGFLSTPSARRATAGPDALLDLGEFLSTPSARRATDNVAMFEVKETISIHALREEGDYGPGRQVPTRVDFYPRPPRGGRRDELHGDNSPEQFLSTPSARRATSAACHRAAASHISIHALREEGDTTLRTRTKPRRYFYPRPPRGGRPRPQGRRPADQPISIHALREEGDSKNRDKISIFKQIIQHSARI